MKFVAFITDYRAIVRIIDRLKLRFMTAKPLAPHVVEQVALLAAEVNGEYI
jgi:hypothetical protein